MNNWTIIKIKTDTGYRFDALQPDSPLDERIDIEFEDGEIISAGSFEIIRDDLTEGQADTFLDLLAQGWNPTID